MSEATTEPTTEQPAQSDPPAQEIDWKQEARKWEERSKSNKTALDELTGKYAAAETQLSELTTKVQAITEKEERATLVSDIATAAGVPASALRGSTREELEAHAAELAALIKPSGPHIPGQEKTPSKIADDPMREFARSLFAPEAQ